MTIQRFIDVPGAARARVDASKVVCARIEVSEELTYVVIHTSEGFAFGAIPLPDQTIEDFYQEVLATIWPTPKRTTK